MEVKTFEIEGLVLFQPRVFEDDRGYFFESFNHRSFEPYLGQVNFVQDNESKSIAGVVRGLHFQKPPFAQGKLVRVVKGSVLDVAVDIRRSSKTYGQHQSVILSEENKSVFWIPEGFAHGFVALEDDTIFSYKCTNYYNKESEDAIVWSDKDLNIDWGIQNAVTSGKDSEAKAFYDFVTPFQ